MTVAEAAKLATPGAPKPTAIGAAKLARAPTRQNGPTSGRLANDIRAQTIHGPEGPDAAQGAPDTASAPTRAPRGAQAQPVAPLPPAAPHIVFPRPAPAPSPPAPGQRARASGTASTPTRWTARTPSPSESSPRVPATAQPGSSPA